MKLSTSMMLRVAILSTFVVAVVVATAQPEVSLYGTSGLRYSLKDEAGITDVILIYPNKDGGTSAVMMEKDHYGYWEYIERHAGVKPGDEIDYEIRIGRNGTWSGKQYKAFPNLEVLPRKSKRDNVIFRDDFNTALDYSKYTVEISAWGGGNGEFQVYTNEPANLYTKGGVLYIKPTFLVDNPKFTADQMYHGRMDLQTLYHACTQSANWGCDRTAGDDILNPIMSGKLTTKASIRYGKVNVRAKIPKGDWLWPAIWMLPKDWKYGGWPRSGEIDIMESRGNTYAGSGGVNHGVNEVAATLHWGPDAGNNRYWKTHAGKRKGNGDWHDWHTYTLEWNQDYIGIFVDGQEVLHVGTPGEGFWRWGGFGGNSIWPSRNAPFDQAFQLILNVAVGGAYFPDGFNYNSPKPWHGGSHPMRDFWEGRNNWQGSWHGEDAAMQIGYFEMIQW